jgi:hypothetical protein
MARITVQLKGSLSDDYHVRLSEFLTQLNALQQALANTETVISGSPKPSLYYRIIDLTHSSPSTVIVEAKSYNPDNDLSTDVVNKFFGGLRQIQETGQISDDFDRPTLEAYKGLSATLRKHITEIKLSNGENQFEITRRLEARIDHILGDEIIVEGSIEGMLEAINLHNNANKFHLFPSVGPQKVACHFPDALQPEAIAAIKRYVFVSGQVKYQRRGFFPHEVEVSTMEVYPQESDLPTLGSLRGIAPNATGKLDSVAFIRSLRNAAR